MVSKRLPTPEPVLHLYFSSFLFSSFLQFNFLIVGDLVFYSVVILVFVIQVLSCVVLKFRPSRHHGYCVNSDCVNSVFHHQRDQIWFYNKCQNSWEGVGNLSNYSLSHDKPLATPPKNPHVNDTLSKICGQAH